MPGLRAEVRVMRIATVELNNAVCRLLGDVAAVSMIDRAEGSGWPDESTVRTAWAQVTKWDEWLATKRRSMPQPELNLHEMTIRWAKGIVKAWRIALAKPKAPS